MRDMPFEDEDPNAEIDDDDGDKIKNKTDVCIEDDYAIDFHESCLKEAGLRVPTRLEFSDADKAYMDMQRALGVRGEDYSVPSEPYYEVALYSDLEIKTCTDLRNYEARMSGQALFWGSMAALVIIAGGAVVLAMLGFTGGVGAVVGGAAGGVAGVIAGWLTIVALAYGNLAKSADDAWEVLCVNHRR